MMRSATVPSQTRSDDRFRVILEPLPFVHRAPTAGQMGLLILLCFFLLYAALTPWLATHYQPTGDEPHYLLITHSLLQDGDINLANNYAHQDYQRFIAADWLDPHVTVQADGAWHPVHEIALALIILPAYALGGYIGVLYFLNLIAALVAANVWRLAAELVKDRSAAWFACVAVGLTLPMLLYAYSVYTEILAALLIVWIARQLVRDTDLSALRWAMLGGALVLLSWLVVRFLPISLALGALSFLRAWRRKKRNWLGWVLFALTGAAVLFGISLINQTLYDNSAAIGMSSAGRGSASLAQLLDPLNHLDSWLGWLWDQRQGLFSVAPIYALIPLGLLLLWSRDRWKAIVIGSILLLQLGLLGFTHFQVRWGIPPRYLVGVMPLAAAPLALAWQALHPRRGRVLMASLLLISGLSAGLVVAQPDRAFHGNYDDSKLWTLYENRFRIPFTRWLPRFMPDVQYKDKGWDDRQGSQSEAMTYLLPQFQPILSPHGRLVPDDQASGGLATIINGPLETEIQEISLGGVLLDGPQLSLPAGAYELRYRLKSTSTNAATAAVARLDVRSDQGELSSRILLGKELGPTYGLYTTRWTLPERSTVSCTLRVAAESGIAADYVQLVPLQPWPARILAASWLCLLLGGSLLGYRRWAQRGGHCELETQYVSLETGELVAYWVGMALLVGISALLMAYHYASLGAPRTYQAEALLSQTGAVVTDDAAYGGQAFHGSIALDEAGWLVYGPYESFQEGQYLLQVRLAAGSSADDTPIATIEMTNVAADPILARIALSGTELEPGIYHDIQLAFANPDWQKLVFRLYFHDIVDIWVDQITIERIGDL